MAYIKFVTDPKSATTKKKQLNLFLTSCLFPNSRFLPLHTILMDHNTIYLCRTLLKIIKLEHEPRKGEKYIAQIVLRGFIENSMDTNGKIYRIDRKMGKIRQQSNSSWR
jgi:hypothetical protein